jgi:hypothetical protein
MHVERRMHDQLTKCKKACTSKLCFYALYESVDDRDGGYRVKLSESRLTVPPEISRPGLI